MKTFIWGYGIPASRLIRRGEATARARDIAHAHGLDLAQPDAWAVEVEADAADLDAATRHDAAVLGWTAAEEEDD